jgi:hypothetical protein
MPMGNSANFGGELGTIDWEKTRLTKFQKDFYYEDDRVKNRSREDIRAYRDKHEISLHS